MTARKKVCILLHEQARYDDTRHPFIWYFAKIWEKSGIEVEALRGIPDFLPSTDVLIAHVDVTVVPPDYVDFINQFSNVINGRLTDISKRAISSDLVGQDDSYNGKVIVKTDMNYGGVPEMQYEWRSGEKSRFLTHVQRPWSRIDCLDPEKYPVFDSIKDVPSGVWRNTNLVVEKFIPEREGDLYAGRAAFFMGESSTCMRVYSRSQIVKGPAILQMEPIETPAELNEIRKRIGLDYGKIDYVVHDGEIHVLDVNKTLGGVEDEDINWKYASLLSDGLLPFLDAANSRIQ